MSCANFRDVGEWVNYLAKDHLLSEKRIFRGGKIDSVESIREIGTPGSIVNLRVCKDLMKFSEVQYYHFPISNHIEKYNTKLPEVRQWIIDSLALLTDESIRFPVLYHCGSGKDRAGIIIATLLLILEVPKQIIIEEYLLSEGKVNQIWILQTLDGIRTDLDKYHKNLDFNLIREKVNMGQR